MRLIASIITISIVGTCADWGAVIAQSSTSEPAKYSCRAARNLAVVGAWAEDGVLIVERAQEQECRFSINGAPAGTPPLQDIREAWATIRRPGLATRASFPDALLAMALSAASPFAEVAPGISDVIKSNSGELLNCFGARDAGQPFERSAPSFTCRTTQRSSSGVLRVEGSPGVEFSAQAPQTQIAIRGTSTVHYLFLPVVRVAAR